MSEASSTSSTAKTPQYTSLRLTAETLRRLATFRDRLNARVRKSPDQFPPFLAGRHPGYEAAILWLLFQEDVHHQRSKTAYRKGAAKLANGRQNR